VALDPIQPEASVQLGPYTRLNPNGKIPAIFDPMVRALYRSDTRDETIQWLKWQMGDVVPMFDQVGFLNRFTGEAFEDKRMRDRYSIGSARLFVVLDERLATRDWITGAECSIADISLLGCVRNRRLLRSVRARRLRSLRACPAPARPWSGASSGSAQPGSGGSLKQVRRGVVKSNDASTPGRRSP